LLLDGADENRTIALLGREAIDDLIGIAVSAFNLQLIGCKP
jgi:hypothetical protein